MRVLLTLSLAVAFAVPILAQQTGPIGPCEFRADNVRVAENGSLEAVGNVVLQCESFVARMERATIDVRPAAEPRRGVSRISGRGLQTADELLTAEHMLFELGKWQIQAEQVEISRPRR